LEALREKKIKDPGLTGVVSTSSVTGVLKNAREYDEGNNTSSKASSSDALASDVYNTNGNISYTEITVG
jgi:hypothetical protein